ncbi:MAG: hypothetical protein PWP51_1444 [Clostridiales bacterium]|jgi:uncharacterized membrane protein YdcZ (DUF606 family)|nr:hypothetical protein [Clostridiales bacterium]MDN5298891.1 hypothetical protein [Clostridiales bacterium]
MIYIVLSGLSGIAVIVNVAVNGIVASRIGTIRGVGITFFTGTIAAGALLLLKGETLAAGDITSVAIRFAAMAGILGIATTFIFNGLVQRIAAFKMVLLRFIGQIGVSILLDYWLFDLFSLGKCLGGICLMTGLMLFTRQNGSGEETHSNA